VRLEDGASSAELGRSTSFNWGAGKAPRTRSRRERISGEEGGLYLSLIASSRERGLACRWASWRVHRDLQRRRCDGTHVAATRRRTTTAWGPADHGGFGARPKPVQAGGMPRGRARPRRLPARGPARTRPSGWTAATSTAL